jgi:hypothetical protein
MKQIIKQILIWMAVYFLWVVVLHFLINHYSLESTVVIGIAMLRADRVLAKYKEGNK